MANSTKKIYLFFSQQKKCLSLRQSFQFTPDILLQKERFEEDSNAEIIGFIVNLQSQREIVFTRSYLVQKFILSNNGTKFIECSIFGMENIQRLTNILRQGAVIHIHQALGIKNPFPRFHNNIRLMNFELQINNQTEIHFLRNIIDYRRELQADGAVTDNFETITTATGFVCK